MLIVLLYSNCFITVRWCLRKMSRRCAVAPFIEYLIPSLSQLSLRLY